MYILYNYVYIYIIYTDASRCMSAWLVTPFVDNLRVLPENGSCLQEWYDETLMPYDAL